MQGSSAFPVLADVSFVRYWWGSPVRGIIHSHWCGAVGLGTTDSASDTLAGTPLCHVAELQRGNVIHALCCRRQQSCNQVRLIGLWTIPQPFFLWVVACQHTCPRLTSMVGKYLLQPGDPHGRLPQATPVPNIPLYYAGYKAYSARRALGGCAALQLMWAQTDTDALTSLRQQLVSLQHSGVIFPIGSWPHRLIKEDTRYGMGWPGKLVARPAPSACITMLLKASQLHTLLLQYHYERLSLHTSSKPVLIECSHAWASHCILPLCVNIQGVHHRYSDILANVEGRMRHVYHGHPPSQMIPSMVASRELDQLAQPQSRYNALLPANIEKADHDMCWL